jgi:carbonic anhydrase
MQVRVWRACVIADTAPGTGQSSIEERHYERYQGATSCCQQMLRPRLWRARRAAHAARPLLCHPDPHVRAADPGKYVGMAEGDAHVIRSAGGRASDVAIRSLVISHKLLGTKEWLVIHHTNCGMGTFDDETMRGLLAKSLEAAVLNEMGWKDVGSESSSREGDYVDWLTVRDLAQSVREDVERIRNHPLVSKSIAVHGFIYDVASGELNEVRA